MKRDFRQNRRSPQPHYGTHIDAVMCTCGRRGYRTKGQARTVLREMRRRKALPPRALAALGVEACEQEEGIFHVSNTRASASERPNLNDPAAWNGTT